MLWYVLYAHRGFFVKVEYCIKTSGDFISWRTNSENTMQRTSWLIDRFQSPASLWIQTCYCLSDFTYLETKVYSTFFLQVCVYLCAGVVLTTHERICGWSFRRFLLRYWNWLRRRCHSVQLAFRTFGFSFNSEWCNRSPENLKTI